MIEQSNSLPQILYSTLTSNRNQSKLKLLKQYKMLICFSLSILWSKTEFLIHIWQVMLKMKSRHIAGTVTKKKKSKPLIFCFCLFSFLLMIWSRIGGGGTPSIWGLEKVVCKLCRKKIKKVAIFHFHFHWYIVLYWKFPIHRCSAGGDEGHSGLARPPPARGRWGPEVLCLEDRVAWGRRVWVPEPKRVWYMDSRCHKIALHCCR